MITSVLVSYNNEKTIEAACLSLINQTFKPSEIIVIDNGSNDNTIKIIKDTIKTVSFPKNQFRIIDLSTVVSISQIRQIAFKESRHTYTSLLFGANFYHPDKLGESLKRFSHDKTFCVYSDFNILNKKFETERIYYPTYDIRYIINGFAPHLDNLYLTVAGKEIQFTDNESQNYKDICQKYILRHCPLSLHTIRL